LAIVPRGPVAPRARRRPGGVAPTLSGPLEQLRLTIRTFLLFSAEHPSCSG
jgi:hypothetical protein